MFTVLANSDDCCACGPIPLFQSDVIGGTITLGTPGLNYCLAENITGNITISGGNVTVDGNDRVLTGRVRIVSNDVIVKNIKVRPLIPLDPIDAALPAIFVTSDNVKILNCFIECANSLVGSTNGRDGIQSTGGNRITIQNCIIYAGNGARGDDSGTGFPGGIGGFGIKLENTLIGTIEDTRIVSGNGGHGGAGSGNGGAGGAGGAGGNGIFIEFGTSQIVVRNVIISGGDGGDGGVGSVIGDSSGGAGGIGGSGLLLRI